MKPILRLLLGVVCLFLLLTGESSRADNLPTANADSFVALFQKSQFSTAAQEFHYPPDSTPQQRRDDFNAIVHFLSGLSMILGNVSSIKRGRPYGVYSELTLGMGAGDFPYWSSHPEFRQIETVTYSLHSEFEGDVSIALNYIQPNGQWKLRSFSYQYPASRPGAKEHIVELAHKLLPE